MLASLEENTRNEISSEFEKEASDFRNSTLLFACRYVVGPLELGKYAFRVRANSIARYGSYTEDHAFEVVEKGVPSFIALESAGFVMLLLSIFVFAGTVIYLRQRYPAQFFHLRKNPCHFFRRLFSRGPVDDRERLIELDSADDWNGIEDLVNVDLRGPEPELDDGLAAIPESHGF